MMPRVLVLAAAATLASAAPRVTSAQGGPDKPPAPTDTAKAPADSAKDIDPVGTYTVYLTAQGNAMTTVTRIDKKDDGGWTGSVTGDGIPPLPVTSVTVKGKMVRVTVTAPDGSEAVIEMIVDGEDISGQWSMANDGSRLSGKKAP